MKFIILVFATLLATNAWAGNNMFLIDSHSQSGFAIYRMGQPDADDMKTLCQLGIEEMMILAGTAHKFEDKHREHCPTLKVIYNEKQNPKKPVSAEFLEEFDQWVQEAQKSGKKIAFRCSCGCHRTGRLAAYYQMKYQNLTPVDAIALMKSHGKYMFLYPSLDNQVRALASHLKGETCNEGKYCIRTERELEKLSFPEYTDDEI